MFHVRASTCRISKKNGTVLSNIATSSFLKSNHGSSTRPDWMSNYLRAFVNLFVAANKITSSDTPCICATCSTRCTHTCTLSSSVAPNSEIYVSSNVTALTGKDIRPSAPGDVPVSVFCDTDNGLLCSLDEKHLNVPIPWLDSVCIPAGKEPCWMHLLHQQLLLLHNVIKIPFARWAFLI